MTKISSTSSGSRWWRRWFRVSAAGGRTQADEQLGIVHFVTSCKEAAQPRFDRAMRYQH